MDGTFMLIFAGAITAGLGGFLAVSEKELRKKRRELASLAAKLSNRAPEILGAEYQKNISTLENANKNLREQLSATCSRLESTERDFAESQSERRRLQSVEMEKAQLESSHEGLKDEMAALRHRFDSEITQSRTEFEKNLKSLQQELTEAQEELQRFASVNRQLLDAEQECEKALVEKRELHQEITRLKEQLGGSEKAQRGADITGQPRENLPREGAMPPQRLKNQPKRLVEPAEKSSTSGEVALTSMNLPSTRLPGPSEMNALEHTYGQTLGFNHLREYRDASRQENQIIPSDRNQLQPADNRAAHLSNLLAWIRLHGSHTYQEQIDSLKDLTDLSETERHLIRDIFLTRADEAQKRGRDEEMLRYRSWAKNIAYRTSFGKGEAQNPSETGSAEPYPKYSASIDGTAIDVTPNIADATLGNPGPAGFQANGTKSPAHNIALGIGIGLGVVLILLVQLFLDTSPEITVASDDASTPTISQTHELASKQALTEASRPAGVYENTLRVDPLRSEGRLKAIDEAKTNARNAPKESIAAANRSQSVWGAYTINKTTSVFSEPNEESAFITSLDPGTQVNVVAARNGWYEIRSKSGRPPGFIRQAGASRNR